MKFNLRSHQFVLFTALSKNPVFYTTIPQTMYTVDNTYHQSCFTTFFTALSLLSCNCLIVATPDAASPTKQLILKRQCACAHCHSGSLLALCSAFLYILFRTVSTIGNCQRPVISLGVCQHMHKITNL